jgi:transposase
LFVEALPCDRKAMDVINDIAELFHLEIESTMRGDDYNGRKQMRQTKSNNCLVRLLCRVTSLSKDPITMSNALMHKAITYLLNQWESLRKFILDGRVQISNNLVEQRMKAIKLNMKVCQNIGSERAAENAAFIFSITESCSLNNIEVESYLEKVFRCLHLENVDKRSLLPCYINN